MATYKEYLLQTQICQFLQVKYPHVLFLSDAISNVSLTPMQQARNNKIQKKGFSCPDLVIYEPSNGYHGLFLELKQESPYTQAGPLKKQKVPIKKGNVVIGHYDHLQEQDRALRMLREKGYKAEFCWSIDMAMNIINEYLKS